MKTALHCTLIALLLISSGCATVIDATTDEPVNLNKGKRTIGAMVDDQQLETIATVNLKKAGDDIKHSNINVVAFNGIILLTGQVPRNELRLLAGDTVKQIHKVRQVFNEIQVQGKTSLLSRTNDTWLTTKVKSNLLANKDIDSGRIKIVTEDGTVYMLGLLSRVEADRAAQAISRIGGVQKVVKAVEYID